MIYYYYNDIHYSYLKKLYYAILKKKTLDNKLNQTELCTN